MIKFSVSRFYMFFIGLLSLMLIQGCKQGDHGVNGENGTLRILLSDSMKSSKTIEPPISMIIASYDIIGTCPGQADVSISSITATQGSVEFDGLATGSWTFTVTGRNSEIPTKAIGSGQGTVSITQGQDADLTIVILPLSGNGTLQLSASWRAESVGSNPVLSGSLKTLGPDEVEIASFTMAVSGNTATYSNSAIVAGYYTLSIVLTDNGTNCGGVTEIVRIAADQTSTGNISIAVSNHGVIVITITQQMNDPVIVSLANTVSSITIVSSMNVTALLTNATAVTYYWYIDGESVATNVSSYTVNGSSLEVGQHRLDLIAITTDNTRAGSTSHVFTVTQ